MCRGHNMFGERCPKESVVAHYIVPKEKGGKDTKQNMVGLCKRHHGVYEGFYRLYGFTKSLEIWLEENGN